MTRDTRSHNDDLRGGTGALPRSTDVRSTAYRTTQEDQARRNLAAFAVDLNPGDPDAAEEWLRDMLATLGLDHPQPTPPGMCRRHGCGEEIPMWRAAPSTRGGNGYCSDRCGRIAHLPDRSAARVAGVAS